MVTTIQLEQAIQIRITRALGLARITWGDLRVTVSDAKTAVTEPCTFRAVHVRADVTDALLRAGFSVMGHVKGTWRMGEGRADTVDLPQLRIPIALLTGDGDG